MSPSNTNTPCRSTAPFLKARLALVATAITVGLAGTTAVAQTSEDLAEVRDRQEQLRAELAAHSEQIDALIGEMSALRVREDAVAAELSAAEAELTSTKLELTGARAELAAKKEELASAIDELEDMLVAMYKSNPPDLLTIVLGASSYSDMIAEASYMKMVQDYQDAVIERFRTLRDETTALVAELEGKVGTLAEARDEIAERQASLAESRAALEAQEAELATLRADRREQLLTLMGREETLVEALTPPAPETVSSPDGTDTSETSAPAPTTSGSLATLNSDGTASAPADAPAAVQSAIAAGNAITNMPYLWGGGHGSFESSGYDCSGSVSYLLHGGGFLSSPLDSTGLMAWGEPGPGAWITVYAHPGHTYVVVAGLRFDTSGAPPRWQSEMRETSGYVATHPPGY